MPRWNRSSLALYSDSDGYERATAVLGLQPKRTLNKGDRKIGRDGQRFRPSPVSVWIYAPPESDVDPHDDSGFSTLRALVNVLQDRADALASLRPEYRTVIRWSGEVSPQGNFTMDADIVVGLGLLGWEFSGSVSLEEIADEGD